MEIRLEDVTFGYNENETVLHNINLTIDEPGLICIIGPNGVGKSTLIRCMNKLSEPTLGKVYIDGKNIEEYTLRDLAMFMSYVPVKTQDCFAMNVIDTILVGRHNKNKWRTTEEDLAAIHSVMKLMGIEDLAMRNFNELSAGQHQKVAIARGLVQDPKILILDEPTSNLDVRHQIYVTQMLRAIAEERGITVIMISHDLNISAKYAHRIIVMSPPGVIYRNGTPDEVITEDVVRHVYGVECSIVRDEGRPHTILKTELPTEY